MWPIWKRKRPVLRTILFNTVVFKGYWSFAFWRFFLFFLLEYSAAINIFIYITAQSYYSPRFNLVHNCCTLWDSIRLVTRTHLLIADCSSALLTLDRWPLFVNNNDKSKWQWNAVVICYLLDCAACFWHGSSRRGRESNNCCDIPNGLIPFNFSAFLLPSWSWSHTASLWWRQHSSVGWKIQSPNRWKSREPRCKAAIKEAKVEMLQWFLLHCCFMFSGTFTANSSSSSQITVKVSNVSLVVAEKQLLAAGQSTEITVDTVKITKLHKGLRFFFSLICTSYFITCSVISPWLQL